VTVPTPTLLREPFQVPTSPRSPDIREIRAVCLDVDDTLVDYASSARAGLTALVGHDEGWRCWPRWYELTERHYERFIDGEIDFDTMRLQRTRAFLAERGERLSDGEVAHREATRAAAMRRAWRLFDDVQPCLHLLRCAGVMLGVITNASSAYQRGKLATVGLIDTFDVVVIAEEVGVAKPEPEIFRLACRQLRVAPHQVMHVGDRLDLDAIGAARAGLTGVWLDRSGRAGQPPAGVLVINELTELPGLLTEAGC
jgi:putative hydrolase of the HAD superfamily